MEGVKVKVTNHGNRRYFVMYYDDPITGKRAQRSTRETTRRKADREAAKWEADLNEGRYLSDSKMTWEVFRERYENEKLYKMSPKTGEAFASVANHLERIINPKQLSSLTAAAISRLQTELRKEGLAETSIAGHLGHLRAALGWAAGNKQKLLAEIPYFDMPKQQKGAKLMRGRAITGEEYERILEVTPKVRPHDSCAWIHYQTGLWLSGLRLEESLIVSWDADEPFAIDLSAKHPKFRIYAEAHKSRRDQYLPMTPDFAEFVLATPEDERSGRLFKLNGLTTGKPLSTKRVCRLMSKIGERARVSVGNGRHSTAHDFRRAFGTRWAKRVVPAMLQKLMRHATIETTMKYYVDLDADEVADELWKGFGGVGTFVGTSQKSSESASSLIGDDTKKPVA